MDFIPLVNDDYRLTVAKVLCGLDNDVNTTIWRMVNEPVEPLAPRKKRITRRSPGRKILDRLRSRGKKLSFF